MKFLNLNLYKGKCLSAVLDYLEKEKFDIIQMQEVSGSRAGFGGVDCFKEIINKTGLSGRLLTNWTLKDDPHSYFGNATFYAPSVILEEEFSARFLPFAEIDDPAALPPDLQPKGALFLRLGYDGKSFWTVNTHMPWGPDPYDEPYKVAQADMLSAALKNLDRPFILSGDFNVVADTEVIKRMERLAPNIAQKYGVTNTLNPAIHRAKHLFPEGLAVDFIFTHMPIKSFKLLSDHCLSDHVGMVIEF